MERQDVVMQSWKTEISNYYKDKILKHGPTPLGVDWNTKESQDIRFRQLLKVVRGMGPYIINDLGCGYGALLDYIDRKQLCLIDKYYGYDICPDMLKDFVRVTDVGIKLIESYEIEYEGDYSFASGTFNIKLSTSEEVWEGTVLGLLGNMYKYSRKGFSFNCLTTKVEYKEPHLYYADPNLYYKHCKDTFKGEVELIENYGVHDWTILVKR